MRKNNKNKNTYCIDSVIDEETAMIIDYFLFLGFFRNYSHFVRCAIKSYLKELGCCVK